MSVIYFFVVADFTDECDEFVVWSGIFFAFHKGNFPNFIRRDVAHISV